ncbi:MAG: hypothetical protein M3436_11285 [Pseudomonadota bacterium]|nr:hypothetical protein [Pseudomonadota bacterium]
MYYSGGWAIKTEMSHLCYVRVPTWAPFRLQVYLNGHHWLAQRVAKAGIAFERADQSSRPSDGRDTFATGKAGSALLRRNRHRHQGYNPQTLSAKNMLMPYEKLKSLPTAKDSLKPGVTFEQLDAIAATISDNEAARRLNEALTKLFQSIHRSSDWGARRAFGQFGERLIAAWSPEPPWP